MADLESIIQQVRSEIRVDINGKGYASISGTARLCGVTQQNLSNTYSRQQSKLYRFLLEYGFNSLEFKEKGVPEKAVALSLIYYAFHAGKRCTVKAKELLGGRQIKRSEPQKRGFVYVIGNISHRICKIGFSAAPEARLKRLQTACPYKLKILHLQKDTVETEKSLHQKFADYKLEGEWFALAPEVLKYFEIPHSLHEVYDSIPYTTCLTLGTTTVLSQLIDSLLFHANDEDPMYESMRSLLERVESMMNVQKQCLTQTLREVVGDFESV